MDQTKRIIMAGRDVPPPSESGVGAFGPAPCVCVLSLSALGDLVVGLPLIGELRRRHPGAHVTMVCLRPAAVALAGELGVADEVIALPPGARRSPPALAWSLLRMRALQADLVLQTFSSHGSFGNLIAGAVNAPVRCGFASGRFQGLLTHLVPVDPHKHLTALNLDLLRRLGYADVAAPAGDALMPAEEAARLFPPGAAQEKFGRYVAVSVGSDPILAFKRWPTARWAGLCRRLDADGITCVFVGADAERWGVDEIIALSGGRGVNLAGRTGFADLASVVRSGLAVVATDGMLLHLASALGRPTVGIFGPTNPDIVGAWGAGHERVWLGLPCSPCYGSLTIGHPAHCTTRECLCTLPVDMVYRSVCRVVASSPVARQEVEIPDARLAAGTREGT